MNVQTASGDLHVASIAEGEVDAKSASGDVPSAIRQGSRLHVDARSMSGDTTSEIELGGVESSTDGPLVWVKAATMSGDIRIVRAWTLPRLRAGPRGSRASARRARSARSRRSRASPRRRPWRPPASRSTTSARCSPGPKRSGISASTIVPGGDPASCGRSRSRSRRRLPNVEPLRETGALPEPGAVAASSDVTGPAARPRSLARYWTPISAASGRPRSRHWPSA